MKRGAVFGLTAAAAAFLASVAFAAADRAGAPKSGGPLVPSVTVNSVGLGLASVTPCPNRRFRCRSAAWQPPRLRRS